MEPLDTSQISSSATSTAANTQGQLSLQRRRRNACTCIGMDGRFCSMAFSGVLQIQGRSRVGDSMPRARSIFSATLKAASSSLTPCCCMSW